MKFYKKGKRGLVYFSKYKNKKIIIKIKNPESRAENRIENEFRFLKILNKMNIGPNALFFKNGKLGMEFVDGVYFLDFIKKENNKNAILKIIKTLYDQLYQLDELKINKEEMSHPHKHIIVAEHNKPVLIDFERAHYAAKPANVTQFSVFLVSDFVSKLLKEKSIKINRQDMIESCKIYKNKAGYNNFLMIIGQIR
ncbi:hypothetical protein HYU07_02315 [Candidatus Woesearchaeota archaeon]|nr:hypothetical protein [Candidatus Woesearchaeota archaeon]